MSKKRKKQKVKKRFRFVRELKRSKSSYQSKLLPDKLMPVFNDHIVLENGYIMSVQCGYHSYSTPKRNLKNLKDYSAFEVALFDNKNNWIVVRLKEWGEDWSGKYDGDVPEKLTNVEQGHAKANNYTPIMPYLPKEDVELLYQYLKKQKRKFVITEKYIRANEEEVCC